MKGINDWRGKRYHSLNAFLQNKFGEKVYRVSIDAGFTCPNRDGTLSDKGCIYCSEDGARAGYVDPKIPVKEQIEQGMEIVGKRYGAKKFIAYFQAYTNTYAPVEKLRHLYLEALSIKNIVGISIGTRPDALSEPVLDLIEDIAKRVYAIVEIGVQTMRDKTLNTLNRFCDVSDTTDAIIRIKKRKNIDILAHLIFGLPGEVYSDMKESVRLLAELQIDAFKFHHLYVQKNTGLELMYKNGRIQLLDKDEYINFLAEIIPRIPRNIVLHRLFGQCDKDKLIAPLWTLDKNSIILQLDNLLERRDVMQGMHGT